MNWKKEMKSWGITLLLFGILYFTGLMTPIVGGLHSLLLYTGIRDAKVTTQQADEVDRKPFSFQGRFIDAKGTELQLESFRGKTIFINLWATWCPPCRAEMPHIESLYQQLQSRDDIEFLMIALDDDFAKSKKFVDKKEFSFPVVHAAYGLNESLQSQSIPTTLVVNPAGEIVFYKEGISNFNTKAFREFLEGQG